MSKLQFNKNDNSKEFEFEAIYDSEVYTKVSDNDYLSNFYYLVLWKSSLGKKNTWELS